jgi:hypothetical protein
MPTLSSNADERMQNFDGPSVMTNQRKELDYQLFWHFGEHARLQGLTDNLGGW